MGPLLYFIFLVILFIILIATSSSKKKKAEEAKKRAEAAKNNAVTQGSRSAVIQPNRKVPVEPVRAPKPVMKQAPVTPIVARAKANAKKYADDQTLKEIENEHGHTEIEASAQAAYVAKERQAHLEYHENPKAIEDGESLLGTVEDLMVKGYSGDLSFDRDFVGEGLDMISNFQYMN